VSTGVSVVVWARVPGQARVPVVVTAVPEMISEAIALSELIGRHVPSSP